MGRILTSPGGGLVDDVKVGGVSVVKDKIAEIPEIPDTSNLVPYKGATTNVNLGEKNWLHAGSLSSDGDIEVYSTSTPRGLTVHSNDCNDYSRFLSNEWYIRCQDIKYVCLQGLRGTSGGYLSLFNANNGGYLELTPDMLKFPGYGEGVISGLADPTEPTQAATKKYVDNTVKNATTETIIDVIFKSNAWTETSENSGIYTQTVSNSNIKSSSNPLLVSRLSSSATTAQQSVYMKNFAIISQGVGSTSDGSVTFKVFKKPTADITVGLRGC